MSELIKHSAWIERLARCLVRDPEDAEDLVQETWLRAIKSPPLSTSSSRSRRAFLGRVIRNLMYQRAREQRHRRSREEFHAVDEALPATADLVAAIDSQRALVDEVLGLPEAQRDVLLLRYFHDLSSAEIARRTNVSPSTVRSRLKRGLHELRSRLDLKAGGDAEPQLSSLILAAPSTTLSPLASSAATPLSLSALLMSKSHALLAAAILILLGAAGIYRVQVNRQSPGSTPESTTTAELMPSRGVTEQLQSEPNAGVPQRGRPDPLAPSTVTRRAAATPEPVVAQEREPDVRLRGRVMDQDGHPVSGASVWVGRPILIEGDGVEYVQRYGPTAMDEPEEVPVASVILTDPRGAFQFEELPAGSYTVWAHRRDSRFGWVAPVNAPDEAAIEISVEVIPRHRRISGVVQDANGQPYPRAHVTYSVVDEGGAMSSRAAVDDHGRFDIEVTLGRAHDIVANDPLADPARPMRAYANGVEPGTLDLLLRLGEASILNLRVRSGDGVPIEDVDVMPLISDGRSAVSVGSYPGPHAGGLVELPLPGRLFELWLSAPGFRDQRLGPLDPETILGVLDVEMERAPEVSGVVTANGLPIAGARVRLYQANTEDLEVRIDGYVAHFEPDGPSVVTGDDGRFVLFHQRGGAYRLLAKHDDFADADSGGLKLGPDENRRNVVLDLDAGGTLTVHAPAGTPEGETVVAYRGIGSALRATVNAEGVATFRKIRPGRWCARLEDAALRNQRGSVQKSSRDESSEVDLPWNCLVRAGEVETLRL